MKRVGKLFPILISDENLSLAIDVVNKTHRWRRRHRPHQTVIWVERTKRERIEDLRKIITEGFEAAPVKHRTIYDTSSNKVREIYEPKLWPDQYIHHALIQIIQQPIMRGMDYWCCGSIPGRGTAHGFKGIKKWMKTGPINTKYCAELDIQHFYQNLQPLVVMSQMEHLIKDVKVLDLISRTLRDGVPIGNYCSQWYANVVLQPLDHMIREELKISYYVRYMDNFTLFDSSKKKLHEAVVKINCWLQKHGMCLKSNWQVFPTAARMPNAMGYRYGHGYTLPRKKIVLRFKRACRRVTKRLSQNRDPTYQQACAILSRVGWFIHCNAHHITRRWLTPIGEKRLKNVIRSDAQRRQHYPAWECIIATF